MSEFTEEQIERIARALFNRDNPGREHAVLSWIEVRGEYRAEARYLTAAGVDPQEPLQRPVKYDDDFIDRGARALHETQNPWIVAHGSWAAAGHEIQQAFRESARVVLTAAGVAPQEPRVEYLEVGHPSGERQPAYVEPAPPLDRDKLIADDDLSDEHLPNRAYKVGRKIAERGDFNGLDAATVFMRGAVYGVRKLAAPQPLDPEKVAEVIEAASMDWQFKFDQYRSETGSDPGPKADYMARAFCVSYTEGKLT